MDFTHTLGLRPDTLAIEARVRAQDFRAPEGMRSRMIPKVSLGYAARSTDLRGFSPRERHNQGNTGTCTVNALTRGLENKRIQKYGHARHIPLSRAWLYFAAREAMDPPEVHIDDGTYISLVADALTKKGVPAEIPIFGRPAEEHWPWVESLDHLCTEPTWMAGRAAYVHKIKTWSKLKTKDSALLEDILLNLSARNPVAIALPIHTGWGNPRKPIPLTLPRKGENGIGHHAVLVVGWDASRSVFIFENSWGSTWWDDGFGYLDPDYVATAGFDGVALEGGFEEWSQAA